ncbi:hypothetical protein SK128_017896, partial [Halocaridina rubra]
AAGYARPLNQGRTGLMRDVGSVSTLVQPHPDRTGREPRPAPRAGRTSGPALQQSEV